MPDKDYANWTNEQLDDGVREVLSIEAALPDPFHPSTDPDHALIADRIARSLHEAADDPDFFACYAIALYVQKAFPVGKLSPNCRSICVAICIAAS